MAQAANSDQHPDELTEPSGATRATNEYSNPDTQDGRSEEEWYELYQSTNRVPVANSDGDIVAWAEHTVLFDLDDPADVAPAYDYETAEHIGYFVVGGFYVDLADVGPNATDDEILEFALGPDGQAFLDETDELNRQLNEASPEELEALLQRLAEEAEVVED